MKPSRFSTLLTAAATSCLALAAPAMAQDAAPAPQQLEPLGAEPAPAADASLPACGGRGAVSWLAGSSDQSDASGSTAPLRLAANVAGNTPSVFAFSLSADGSVRVEAQSAEGDPMIELISATGEGLAENDDTTSSLNSSLEQALSAGTYCVVVSNIQGDAMEATVQVSRPDQPALLNETASPGSGGSSSIATCTPETEAQPLTEGALEAALENGNVTAAADGTSTSYFRFTLSEPTPLTVRGSSDQLDPFIKIFDNAGAMLGENDDAEGTNARLDYPSPLPAGDYCIGIAAYSPTPGPMTVAVEKLDRDTFLRGAYQRGELVPPLDGSFPVEQFDLKTKRQTVLLHNGGAQWLTFQLDAPAVVVMNAYGSLLGADTKLALFSEQGAVMGENDDSESGTDSKLGPIMLAPGRYALAVSDLNRATPETGGAVRPIGVLFDLYTRVEPEQAQ
ncbi:DVUA0089 family protein [Paracoccus sp. 11-3]|uniref:DVUA0089 family protein n=1 Tax=Paracoccus amoyensis TaxID=2760093 RepID=A0A926G6Y7_9RHOB|nr:DVUA0089 family protein [Paracoccus amoyensis]MBC9246958.1 DVUA0089 family protein [Paracoccus amoyensis]